MSTAGLRLLIVWSTSILMPALIILFLYIYLSITSLYGEATKFFDTISAWYDFVSSLLPYLLLALMATLRIRKLNALKYRIKEHSYIMFDFGVSIVILTVFNFVIWNSLYFDGDYMSRLWGRTFGIFLVPVFGVILVVFTFHARLFLNFLRKMYFVDRR
jgi:hypothetical protein